MGLHGLRKKGRQIDLREPGFAGLRHLQEVAQQRIQPVDLLQDGGERRLASRAVGDGQRVFGLQPHRRDGVADLVGEARRHPPESGEPLGGGGAAALQRKPFAGDVERVDEAVELWRAGARQDRQVDRAAPSLAQGRFDSVDLARPDIEQAGQPGRRAEDRQRQQQEPGEKLIVGRAFRGEGPRHGPSGEPHERAAQRTGLNDQDLGPPALPDRGGTTGAQRLGIDLADGVEFGGRKIGLRSGAFIGREGIGEGARIGLPDAALDADRAGQGALYHGRELLLQGIVDLAAAPAGDEELVAIGEIAAGARGQLLGAGEAGIRGLLEGFEQQIAGGDAGGHQHDPESEQSGAERAHAPENARGGE